MEREKMRHQMRKEREREMRLESMKGNMKKDKLQREKQRDIGEKIALGLLTGDASGRRGGEADFDARLFNQSAGLGSGFGGEDEYSLYNQPLFQGSSASSGIYRPKRDDSDMYGSAEEQLAALQDTSRFKPSKGFSGTDGGESGGPRSKPVQFEKAKK